MLQSQLFSKTQKSSREYDSVNATLLTKAGFIDQVMAGVYTFLPLGWRVLNKIENIIREEMDKIGIEVFMPAIVPTELWEQTERIDSVDVLFKVVPANINSKEKNDAEYILNSTHEEVVTPLAKKFNFSYKDFPFAVYQIQTKFRNEARAKSGLLRGREFRMKDLYSFHTSEEDLQDYYHNKVKQAYIKIYDRLGIGEDTVIALASGGDFTKNFSHEFQTKCENGEDWIFFAKSINTYYNREVAPCKVAENLHSKEKFLELKEVFTKNINCIDGLIKFLNLPIEKCVKTVIFENEKHEVIVAALRGDREIDEGKLIKLTNAKTLTLASPETVKKITGAEIGYEGIIHLPRNVKQFYDNSIEHLHNFECGANKTNYHNINVNWGRDVEKPEKFYDFKVAKQGDLHEETEEVYEVFKASEVGNIFQLNTKFTNAIDYTFTDQKGEQKPIFMGCYGIGTTRVMGVIVEKFHDEKGIIWPENIAPFAVHLIGLNLEDRTIFDKAKTVYSKLLREHVEVLFDDRDDVSAGEKFSDCDLIGIPYRVVISKKTGDLLEVKRRGKNEIKIMNMEKFLAFLEKRNK